MAPFLPRPSAILFDLDGTLIDSVTLIVESARYAFEGRARSDFDELAWLADLGMPLPTMFRRFTAVEEEVQALIAGYREFQVANHDSLVTAYPRVPETVNALRTMGFRLAIVTSKSEPLAERGLAHVGILDCFETIVGLHGCSNHKPHPEPVRVALQRLGVSATEAWFVGDSPHDMNAGRAAGVTTLAALWGPFSREQIAPSDPDAWLDRITDLLRFVEPNDAGRHLSQWA